MPRAKRRRFSHADKRRILEAADRCTKPAEVGALLRRESVYSSNLSTWRRQREAAELGRHASRKRGPKPDAAAAETRQKAQLIREKEACRGLAAAFHFQPTRARQGAPWRAMTGTPGFFSVALIVASNAELPSRRYAELRP